MEKRTNQLSEMIDTNEIISFIYEKDEFYQNEDYINNENRDPKIFEYITIWTNNPDYQYNINILREKQIWKLFNKSKENIINEFHKVFLEQVLNIKDLENLLNLFPDKEINKAFIAEINNKLVDIIQTCFNERNDIFRDKNLFHIFEHILVLNKNNGLNILDQIKLVDSYFDEGFTSNYLFG